MTFLIVYGVVFLVILLVSFYMDIEHYKAYKSLPNSPTLLIGLIVAAFWPLMLVLFTVMFIGSWFGIIYGNLIKFLAK